MAVPVAPAMVKTVTKFGSPVKGLGHRVLLYGPGGIGKTTLALGTPSPVVFFDLDESLGRLGVEVPTVNGIEKWAQLRAALQGSGWDDVKTIVIDTGTRAEEMAVAHTLETVRHEKGHVCKSIEDYGYGKGYTFVFDTFLQIMADLDAHARAGRNIIIIAHDCTTTVPNPQSEDWLRYEPRLQSPTSGKASIRLRLREWCDHVLFLGYDVVVDKMTGKGKGSGTRTLWRSELPHCMAKSRTGQDPVAVGNDAAAIWAEIIR